MIRKYVYKIQKWHRREGDKEFGNKTLRAARDIFVEFDHYRAEYVPLKHYFTQEAWACRDVAMQHESKEVQRVLRKHEQMCCIAYKQAFIDNKFWECYNCFPYELCDIRFKNEQLHTLTPLSDPNRVSASKKLKVLDLFCGAGGLSLGFAQEGFKIELGIDNDSIACDTFRYNFHCRTIQTDISQLKSINALMDGHFDVILAGPPCLGYSRANPTRHNKKTRRLYLHSMKLAIAHHPRLIVFENAQETINTKEFRMAVTALEKAHYDVKYKVMNASDYGVPQHRKRTILVATFIGWQSTFVSEPDLSFSFSDVAKVEHETSINEAFAILPHPSEEAVTSEGHLARLRGEKESFGASYKRMYMDRPAPTLTTQTHAMYYEKDGNFYFPTFEQRTRLQSFPDSFLFSLCLSNGDKFKLIGNAVPPLFSRALAKAVKTQGKRQRRFWYYENDQYNVYD